VAPGLGSALFFVRRQQRHPPTVMVDPSKIAIFSSTLSDQEEARARVKLRQHEAAPSPDEEP